jgi:hypothetical protein
VTTSASGRRQIFTAPNHPGKLKSWKPEKLTALHAHPDRQDFRFSGFQVFTRATVSVILPNEPGLWWGWECPT